MQAANLGDRDDRAELRRFDRPSIGCVLIERETASAARTIRSHPWTSLGLGLFLFVVTPVVAIVLMTTIVGVLAGLVVGARYPVVLLFGSLTGAVFLAERGGRLVTRRPELSTGGRIISLILVLVVLALIGLIPIVGAIIAWLAAVFGLGAWTYQTFRRWSEART